MASGAAKRYTQAVFGLAKERGTIAQWQADLGRLDTLMRDPGAARYLASPSVSNPDKQRLLDTALADGQQESRNLARILLQRNRLPIIPEMARLYADAELADRNIAIAEVTTAEPLDAAGEEMVKRRLKQLIGKEIELKTKIDPEIIGGIVARVGDQLIDGSVINQLRRLRTRLAAG